jgi:hypothetical protein
MIRKKTATSILLKALTVTNDADKKKELEDKIFKLAATIDLTEFD